MNNRFFRHKRKGVCVCVCMHLFGREYRGKDDGVILIMGRSKLSASMCFSFLRLFVFYLPPYTFYTKESIFKREP